MKLDAFSQMVVADCMQRHAKRVESARQRVSILASDLDSARTTLERAVDDQKAFHDFVRENQP